MRLPESAAMRVGAGLAVFGMAMPLTSCESHNSHDEQSPAVTCFQPSPADITAVDNLFNAAPLYQTDPQYIKPGGGKGSIDTPAIARKYGLSLASQALQRKVDADYSQKAPYATIFADAARYLARFGVSLSVAKPGELSPGGKEVPSMADLQTHTSLYDINELTEGFVDLPLQYVRFSGLKKIVLAKGTGDAAYANVAGPHNTAVVDITSGPTSPQLMSHEAYHLLDTAECGSWRAIYNDPGYASFNHGNIYAIKGGSTSLTGPAIQEATTRAIERQNQPGTTAACAAQAALDDLLNQAVTYTDYGMTNVAEDKAELGRNIAVPSDYSELLSPNTPVIKSKFEYLLARLYHVKPGLVKYFAAVSGWPDGSEYQIVKNCKN